VARDVRGRRAGVVRHRRGSRQAVVPVPRGPGQVGVVRHPVVRLRQAPARLGHVGRAVRLRRVGPLARPGPRGGQRHHPLGRRARPRAPTPSRRSSSPRAGSVPRSGSCSKGSGASRRSGASTSTTEPVDDSSHRLAVPQPRRCQHGDAQAGHPQQGAPHRHPIGAARRPALNPMVAHHFRTLQPLPVTAPVARPSVRRGRNPWSGCS
jgi:hypothetical protein